MSTPDFLVVFSGATLDGFEPLTVQTQVEAALRLTEDQSGTLFSGKPVVIKRTQDKTEALTLAQQLKKLGRTNLEHYFPASPWSSNALRIKLKP